MRILIATLVCILAATAASAHRVNIFALVEGQEVVVECSYSKSKPVMGGRVQVLDGATDAVLLEGTTTDTGVFRFPVPEAARQHGLRLVLIAGEGHQNEWRMEPAEFGGAPAAVSPSTAKAASPAAAAAPQAGAGTTQAINPAELETIVRAAVRAELDAKLAPLRRALLEDSGPRLQDVLGGIGWIFGLIGVAAYFGSRRHG
jgi:nickel transport protein